MHEKNPIISLVYCILFVCVSLIAIPHTAYADIFQVNDTRCCFRFGERLYDDGGTGGQYLFSHTFNTDVTLESVSLPLYLSNLGSQNISVEIRTGAVNGSTRGTLVYTSNSRTTASPSFVQGTDTMPGGPSTALKSLQTITFPSNTNLTGGTEYFFIIKGDGSNLTLTGVWAATPFSTSPNSKRIYWLSDWTSTSWQNSPNWGAMGISMLFTYSVATPEGGGDTIIINKPMHATTTCLTTASGTSCFTEGYDYSSLIFFGILTTALFVSLILFITWKR